MNQSCSWSKAVRGTSLRKLLGQIILLHHQRIDVGSLLGPSHDDKHAHTPRDNSAGQRLQHLVLLNAGRRIDTSTGTDTKVDLPPAHLLFNLAQTNLKDEETSPARL